MPNRKTVPPELFSSLASEALSNTTGSSGREGISAADFFRTCEQALRQYDPDLPEGLVHAAYQVSTQSRESVSLSALQQMVISFRSKMQSQTLLPVESSRAEEVEATKLIQQMQQLLAAERFRHEPW